MCAGSLEGPQLHACAESPKPTLDLRGWCQSCNVCITPWQLANDPCCRSNCPQQRVQGFFQWLTSSISKKNKCDITRYQHVSGPEAYVCPWATDEEWRQLNSSKTRVQTTCWVLLDVSLLHKMHASMCFWSRCYFWIIMVKQSSHPLCVARWLAQQLVASLLLPKEPPNSQNPLNHWVSRWILRFVSSVQHWVECRWLINFQHPHACQEDGCQPMQRGDEVVRTSVLCLLCTFTRPKKA